jgi:dTDP-4-amino-4,6-dideoxygalactose transaminase
MSSYRETLAIHGGERVRQAPMPGRRLFDESSFEMVRKVFEESWESGIDFGYQGGFEERFTDAFCEFQGGGFADGVSSGTAAVYLALAALDIDPGSDVIVSPVTDHGSVSPVILQGFRPVVADAAPGSFNVGMEEFERAITPKTRAAIITHLGGLPAAISEIVEMARVRGIKVVEDCSQASGALYRGKRVGRFGDIAAFSTMFSKNLATGGCGGLVYTGNEGLYWRVRSIADRGKPFDAPDYNPKDPSRNLFPALNFNLDELSSAIGLSTLNRLEETIEKRIEIARGIGKALSPSKTVSPAPWPEKCRPSLLFYTVRVDAGRLSVTKTEFAKAVMAEGIGVNPDYRFLVADWKWLRAHLDTGVDTPNARAFRDSTFNILFHERYSQREVEDIAKSVLKAEAVLTKRV